MSYTDLSTLQIGIDNGVATVKINNPPLNVLDETLILELRKFTNRVREDSTVRVIVFESADPEFFLAHGDMRFITEPERMAAHSDEPVLPGMNLMQTVHEDIRALPQITIGKIRGFARGGGNEFLMALDMRFAAVGASGQSQPEAAMDIMPGGGGTQYLTALVGRPRSLELILGGELADAQLAERYGMINRALPDSELDEFVSQLSRRIANLDPNVVSAISESIDASSALPLGSGLARENHNVAQLFTPKAAQRARDLLSSGAQTRAGERQFEELLGFTH